MSQNRIHYIDIAKGIGIYLILLGHSIPSGHLYGYLYSFHVPLFFILSGMTFKVRNEESFLHFFEKKSRSLLVPYFLFGILALLVFSAAGGKKEVFSNSTDPMQTSSSAQPVSKPIPSPKINLLRLFLCEGERNRIPFNRPLWFLPVLFTTEIVFFLLNNTILQKRKRYYSALAVVLFIAGILWFILDRKFPDISIPFAFHKVPKYILFLIIGIYCRGFFETERITNLHAIPCFCIALFLIVLGIPLYFCQFQLPQNGTAKFLLLIFTSVVSSAGYIFFSFSIRKSSFLELIGRNTLVILCAQRFPVTFFGHNFGITKTWLRSGFLPGLFLTALISLLLCLALSLAMTRWTPWLIGIKQVKSVKL